LKKLAVLIFCSVWLAGCVSALTQKLGGSRTDETPKAKAGLVKPQMAGNSEAQTPSDKSDGSRPPADKQPNPAKSDGVETAKAMQAQEKSADDNAQTQAKTRNLKEKNRNPSVPGERAEDESSLPSSQEIRNSFRGLSPDPAEKQRGAVSGKRKSGADALSDSDATKDALDEKEGDAPALQKHDHAKYVQYIRSKAIDQVNKEKDVTLARICRDSTTEEWTLTMYQRRQPNYSFVTYMWDEVDGKWERAFSSGTRPISGWKQHLDFASAGKDCKVLKGSGGE